MQQDSIIYLGIVIQNNDPEMRGRVKIYIPLVAPTVAGASGVAGDKGLNANTDKFFNYIGKNNSTSNEIVNNIKNLKDVLPWAEYAGPICAGNASGRYNATSKTGTTSDSNTWDGDIMTDGFRPVQNYLAEKEIPDAFAKTGEHKNRFVNQYAHEYTPSNYSGLARGMFSIPNVGAHVYVFFMNGDRNFPIYFASAYSQEDVKRIFTMTQDVNDNTNIDYPATYENTDNKAFDAASKTFRSKTVINSNKNTIELIDTDLREMIKFTHYSGSFKEFNNYSTTELATNNDQKLVMGDQFLSINRNQSEYIKVHKELIVGGDHYINIGETDHLIVKQILDIHKLIHEYKMLFDIQRAEFGTQAPNNLSSLQKRLPSIAAVANSNGFALCPICQNKKYDPYDPEYSKYAIGNYADPNNVFKEAPIYKTENCHLPSAPTADDTPLTEEEIASQAGIPFATLCHSYTKPTGDGSVTDSEIETNPECTPIDHPHMNKLGYYRGIKCACCNNITLTTPTSPEFLPSSVVGYSPSTEGGGWKPDPMKLIDGDMDEEIKVTAPQLFDLEKELGEGGEEIKTISMNKIETIGLVMNDMPSFRVDPIGKLKIDGCWVAPQGTYNNFLPAPHVEYVDVADIPGGDYILTCMNKYKLLVGSRGVNIETSGPLDIYGTIMNINAEQLNIGSKNEIVIDGGERLTLRGKKITVLPVNHNAFVVEGQIHVTRNMIVEGGAMLEGEVAVLHITAPLEWQETAPAFYEPNPDLSCVLQARLHTKKGMEHPGVYEIQLILPRHTHYFKNIPLTLLQHPEAVRDLMNTKGINDRNKLAAASTAANPTGDCDKAMWDSVKDDFLDSAYILANATFKQGTGRPDVNLDINLLVLSNRICTVNDTGTTKITDIRATYTWTQTERIVHSGVIRVNGTVDSNGDISSGPTAV